jgi:hypothetical protein
MLFCLRFIAPLIKLSDINKKKLKTMENNNLLNTIFLIVNALGSLATFGAFVFLFFKDTQKQNQIERLTNIGDNIKEQNQMLDKSNKLLDEQVSILRQSLTSTKLDDKASKRLAEIENQKLLLSIQPRFCFESAIFSACSGHIKLKLKNKGEVAKIINASSIQNNVSISDDIAGRLVEKDKELLLNLITQEPQNSYSSFEMILTFADRLKNEYHVKIIGSGQRISLEELGDKE